MRWRCMIVAAALVLGLCGSALAWGAKAHQIIARSAALALPEEVRPFFLISRDVLAEHANDPDLWAGKDQAERNRHYLDIDKLSAEEAANLPASLDEAYRRIGRAKLDDAGLLPWRIAEFEAKLTVDLRKGDWNASLLTAAALCHYVADGHQPFHATANYDGQLTGNLGVHGRFEIEMIERFVGGDYVTVGAATPVKDPFASAVQTIRDSLALAPACLKADNAARAAAPLDTEEYYLALYRGCGEIALRRMSEAAQATAGYWYAAWVAAGKPALPPQEAVVVLIGGPKGETWSDRVTAALAVKQALAGRLHAFDAVALRLAYEPKTVWERGTFFRPAGRRETPPLGAMATVARVTPYWARRATELYGLTHTPDLAIGIAEAADALAAFPSAKRRLVLVSDGLAREKRFNAAVLGKLLRERGVALECCAVGEEGRKDAGLKELVAAAGGKMIPIATMANAAATVGRSE